MVKRQAWTSVGLAVGMLCCLNACGGEESTGVENLATTVEEEIKKGILESYNATCNSVSYQSFVAEGRKNKPDDSNAGVEREAKNSFIDACAGKIVTDDSMCKVGTIEGNKKCRMCNPNFDVKTCLIQCSLARTENQCLHFPSQCNVKKKRVKTGRRKTGRKCVRWIIIKKACTKHENVYEDLYANVFDKCVQK